MIETKCVCGVSYYFGEAWDHVNCKAPVVKEQIVEEKQPILHLPIIAKKRGRPSKFISIDEDVI